MCEAKPGLRCAADTRDHARAAVAEYEDAYPDGPPVTPLTRLLESRVSEAEVAADRMDAALESFEVKAEPYGKAGAVDYSVVGTWSADEQGRNLTPLVHVSSKDGTVRGVPVEDHLREKVAARAAEYRERASQARAELGEARQKARTERDTRLSRMSAQDRLAATATDTATQLVIAQTGDTAQREMVQQNPHLTAETIEWLVDNWTFNPKAIPAFAALPNMTPELRARIRPW